ncbi:sulfotransferase [Sphingomonas sp. LHG3406-1]|uniref:sulfotransferase family protein n=1 Tax=Sphingomonas sp. LHG3406-1 TaxID=2804617 RepID=UPI00261B2EA2|nr:sulfotransferase [Sphingomonas sp. LHG3406-1]
MNEKLPLVSLVNRALARAPAVSLDPQEIERFVLRRTGAERVPGDHWRPYFRQLCHDLEHEAALSPLGRVIANGQLVGLLTGRVRAEQLLAREPAIHAEPIRRPVIIMGPMRSGSTRLQRLLACDPRFACTHLHESLFPVPRGRGNRLRIAAAAAVHGMLRALNPAIQRVHPSGATRPDEEFGYLALSLTSAQAGVQWRVPQLVAAERHRDWSPVTAELATMLRMNGWAGGGVGERRWLLKCPAYAEMADDLLSAFPDAQVIHLSRDPVKVVASSASLVFEQRRIHSDSVDRREIGPEWLERTLQRQRLQAAARTRHPQVAAFDLHYDEVNADWQGVIHRLYRFLRLPLTAEVLAAMQAYLTGAKAHRAHRYRIEEFGLNEEEVRAAFLSPIPPAMPGALGDLAPRPKERRAVAGSTH